MSWIGLVDCSTTPRLDAPLRLLPYLLDGKATEGTVVAVDHRYRERLSAADVPAIVGSIDIVMGEVDR